jgi:hypothetical protein
MMGIATWGGLSQSPSLAGTDQALTILSYPAEAPAASAFFVRVRIVNTGRESLPECQVVDGRIVSDGHCLVLGYRFWRAPKRMAIPSIEPANLLATREVLAPGASVERTVRFQTPRRPPRNVEQHVLHVYLVRGPRDALEWTHIAAPLSPGSVPAAVRLREWVTLLLLAIYVSSLAWAVWRAVRGWRMREVPACSR